MKRPRVTTLIITLMMLCCSHASFADQAMTISPAHVYQKAQTVEIRLQQIAKRIGKPLHSQSALSVSNAQPREVYFQAQTLLNLSTQLNHEINNSHSLVSQATYKPHALIAPKDVLKLINQADNQLISTETRLNIKKTPATPALQTNIKPTDVYNLLLKINTQVNSLLDTSVTTTNVYSALTFAMHLTSNLLEDSKKIKHYPNLKQQTTNASPKQLLESVTACYRTLERYAHKKKQPMLSIQLKSEPLYWKQTIQTANDLSQAIIAELFYLNYANDPNFTSPTPLYQANYKTIGETVQRANLLLQMLEQLMQHSKTSTMP